MREAPPRSSFDCAMVSDASIGLLTFRQHNRNRLRRYAVINGTTGPVLSVSCQGDRVDVKHGLHRVPGPSALYASRAEAVVDRNLLSLSFLGPVKTGRFDSSGGNVLG